MEQALRDVRRHYLFHSPNSRRAPEDAAAAILRGALRLEEFPEIGRRIGNVGRRIRQWPIRFGATSYLILYRLDPDEVTIMAVRNSRELGY